MHLALGTLELSEGEVEMEERPHHQALGRGVDMTTVAIALKYLVIHTIELALLRAIERSVVGEVKVEVEETAMDEAGARVERYDHKN